MMKASRKMIDWRKCHQQITSSNPSIHIHLSLIPSPCPYPQFLLLVRIYLLKHPTHHQKNLPLSFHSLISNIITSVFSLYFSHLTNTFFPLALLCVFPTSFLSIFVERAERLLSPPPHSIHSLLC